MSTSRNNSYAEPTSMKLTFFRSNTPPAAQEAEPTKPKNTSGTFGVTVRPYSRKYNSSPSLLFAAKQAELIEAIERDAPRDVTNAADTNPSKTMTHNHK